MHLLSPINRDGIRFGPTPLCCQPLTDKADIYSLGMVFYSVVAGREFIGSLRLACKNKTRPIIGALWHKGFMEVSRYPEGVSALAFSSRNGPKRLESVKFVTITE